MSIREGPGEYILQRHNSQKFRRFNLPTPTPLGTLVPNTVHNNSRLIIMIDHWPVPAVISGFAKGEYGLVSEHVHSRLACCKPVTYSLLTSIFSAYGFVLVGQKIILTIIGLIRRNENNIKHHIDIRNKRNLLTHCVTVPQAAASGDDDGYQGTLPFCRHANLILFENRNRLYSLFPWPTGGQQDEFCCPFDSLSWCRRWLASPISMTTRVLSTHSVGISAFMGK